MTATVFRAGIQINIWIPALFAILNKDRREGICHCHQASMQINHLGYGAEILSNTITEMKATLKSQLVVI